MKISSKKSHWVLSLVLVVFFTVAAAFINAGANKKTISATEQNTIVYGADGKSLGQTLLPAPIDITDDYIIFEDRVLHRCRYSTEDIDFTIKSANTAFDWVPGGVNKYYMVAPLRVAFESNTSTDDRENALKTIEEIYDEINSDVTKIDAVSALNENADEYIYYRTAETWTTLGAYYAAKEFLLSKGVDAIPIENYYDERFENYIGVMRYIDGTESLDLYPDVVHYYLLKNSGNMQTITALEGKEYKEYTSPVVAPSRGGTDIFIGEYYSHSIIEGDNADGGSIIIIGDKYAKIFAPWLIPYYSRICLVNPAYYNRDAASIEKMIDEYNAQDFLVVQSQLMFGDSIENQVLSSMFAQPTGKEE